jgi:uncharacterized protein
VELVDRWQRGELEPLSEDECRELLEARNLGRLAYNDGEGPVITPVSYALNDGAILLATSPLTQLAQHASEAVVAFEVEDIDADRRSGWSVLVRGRTEVVEYAHLPASHAARPAPWATGERTLYLRITPTALSGRRLHPA